MKLLQRLTSRSVAARVDRGREGTRCRPGLPRAYSHTPIMTHEPSIPPAPLAPPRVSPPRWARQLAGVLAFALVLMFARASLADHYVVPSGSMEPTIQIGDRILVNKAAFGWRVPLTDFWLGAQSLPARGSVIVLSSPEPGPVLLKRVVALPRDVVEVRSGRREINGKTVPVRANLAQPSHVVEYLGPPHEIQLGFGGGPDFGPEVVPDGKMLVLGDNRGNSRDGRYFGFVDGQRLRGQVLGVYARSGRPTWRGL
jgi:signal peptidase I